ncbi:unnamed protein product, partial [Nesidiocoris tenuis]
MPASNLLAGGALIQAGLRGLQGSLYFVYLTDTSASWNRSSPTRTLLSTEPAAQHNESVSLSQQLLIDIPGKANNMLAKTITRFQRACFTGITKS